MTERLRHWGGIALALVVLNAALSFHNIWPTPWITLRPEISSEAAGIVVLIVLWRRFLGGPATRGSVVLTAVLLGLVAARYMEVTAPALYGRAVNLYWDLQYMPDVAAMLLDAAPGYLLAVGVIAMLCGIGMIGALLHWSVRRVGAAAAHPPVGRVLGVVSASLVGLYLLGYYAHVPTLRWFSIPVSQTYLRQAEQVADALRIRDSGAELFGSSALSGIDFGSAPRRDILLAFIESYGAIAYDEPEVAAQLAAGREGLAQAIQASDRGVVSAFVESPTFGGGSWLAHISLMSGLWIDDPALYSALLIQNVPTLPKLLKSEGYRSIALMPGLKGAWPEGSFYGFDRIYGAVDLNYRGPEFGWWRIPDQYALGKLQELELDAPERPPLFVFFPTISTHAPFRPTPPYQPDWERLRGVDPYPQVASSEVSGAKPDWLDLRSAYIDAVHYMYAYWSGFLGEHTSDDFVLVMIGDHQPPASVSGPDARADVPVHIISRDGALQQRLLGAGFMLGLTPADGPALAMHELAGLLAAAPER